MISIIRKIGIYSVLLCFTIFNNAQTVTIDLNTEYQLISGFGGMNHTGWRPDLNEDVREKVFGNEPGEMGLSILRIHIDPDSNVFYRSVPTALNAYNKGATVFASPWDPPLDLTVRNASNERKLLYENYDAYVDHLNSFISYMSDSGVPLHAISIQNEPDIEENWTSWTPNEILTFLKENAQDINAKVMAPESYHFASEYNNPILNDSLANAHFDILVGHIYGSGLEDIPLAREKGKEVWMTEHLFGDKDTLSNDWDLALVLGEEINDCMLANFNAYVWWYIQRFYGLISKDGNITDKGFAMSQYSKFIRPGAVRVDATVESISDVEISAYKTDTSLIVVVLNLNDEDVTLDFNIQNATIDSLTQFTSSATKKVVNDGAISSNGGTYTATIDARSITTFTSDDDDGGKYANIAPVANVGIDIDIFDNDMDGFETITLDATGSSDIDGKIKNYSWSYGEVGSLSFDKIQISTDSIYEMDFDLGEYEVVLTVTDNDGAIHSDTLLVIIRSLLNTNLWFETECTDVGSNWDVIADNSASNGVYVTVKTGTESIDEPTNTDDILVYNFHANEGGRYKVWARVLTKTANDDSYWVKIDDGTWTSWNNIPTNNNWHWDDVHGYANNDSTLSYDLDTGYHTLYICFREDGAQLDKIFISNTGADPSGLGDPANNCMDNIEPVANAGPDQSVTISSGSSNVTVTLDGSMSTDADGEIIFYVWSLNDEEVATGINPTVDLEDGNYEIELIVTDDKGAADTDFVIIDVIDTNTGIPDNIEISFNEVSSVLVYPNPANTDIQISWDNMFNSLVILNMEGRKLVEKKYSSPIRNTNLSLNLKPGLYFLWLSNNETFNVTRLVKE